VEEFRFSILDAKVDLIGLLHNKATNKSDISLGSCSRENVTSLSAIIQWFPEGFHLNPTNDSWS